MAEPMRSCGGLAIAAVALALAACSPPGSAAGDALSTPKRAGRFGSLRDFVLFQLPGTVSMGGPGESRALFFDRFEVTRGDWGEFAVARAGDACDASSAAMYGDPALPVGRVSLRQSRAFASWRFARLPRRDEWVAVLFGDRRYRFPWGPSPRTTCANTAELGLGQPTLVGTFESGRRDSGGQPYDLIGNVSEWTESVPVEWCLADYARGDPLSLGFDSGRREALAMPALAVWQPMPGVLPAITAVAARSETVPREVVGADFQFSMTDRTDAHAPVRPVPFRTERDLDWPSEQVLGGDRRLRTGIRLVTTPGELLTALVAADVDPKPLDYEQLARFIARPGHRTVLRTAFVVVARGWTAEQNARPLARWLRERLGP